MNHSSSKTPLMAPVTVNANSTSLTIALHILFIKTAPACPPGIEAIVVANSPTKSESTTNNKITAIVEVVSSSIPILSLIPFNFCIEIFKHLYQWTNCGNCGKIPS